MAKNSVRDFSATAASNTDIQSVNIDESCPASGINNAIRELMADIKDVSTGTVALESPQADSLTVTGDLTVDTNTLHVDATNNKVGIGNSSPAQLLSVGGTSSGTKVIQVTNSTAGTAFNDGMQMFINDSAGGLNMRENYPLEIYVNGGKRATFLAGGGLTFNGDTATANALDDYEEGSYTPQISATDGIGTLTYTYQVGRYTKVGNRVMFNAYVQINNKGTAAGLFRITTPFTPANISQNHVPIAHWINGSQNNQAFEGERVTYAYLAANEPIVRFYSSNGDGGLNHLSAAHVKNGTDFMISGTFQV